MKKLSYMKMILGVLVLYELPLYCEPKTEEGLNLNVSKEINNAPESTTIMKGLRNVNKNEVSIFMSRRKTRRKLPGKDASWVKVDYFETVKPRSRIRKLNFPSRIKRSMNPKSQNVKHNTTVERQNNKWSVPIPITEVHRNKTVLVKDDLKNNTRLHETIIEDTDRNNILFENQISSIYSQKSLNDKTENDTTSELNNYDTFVDEQGDLQKNISNTTLHKIVNEGGERYKTIEKGDYKTLVYRKRDLKENISNNNSQENIYEDTGEDKNIPEEDYDTLVVEQENWQENILNVTPQEILNEGIDTDKKITKEDYDALVVEQGDLKENILHTTPQEIVNKGNDKDKKIPEESYDPFINKQRDFLKKHSLATSQETLHGDAGTVKKLLDVKNDMFVHEERDLKQYISKKTQPENLNRDIEKGKKLEEYEYETFVDTKDIASRVSKLNTQAVGNDYDECLDEHGYEQEMISTEKSKELDVILDENLNNVTNKVKVSLQKNNSNTKSQEKRAVDTNTNKPNKENNVICVDGQSEHNKKNDTNNSESNAGKQGESGFKPPGMKRRTLYDTSIKKENGNNIDVQDIVPDKRIESYAIKKILAADYLTNKTSNTTSQELLSKDSENYKEYVQKNLSDIVPPEAISISTEKDEDNLNRKIRINTSPGSIGSKVNKKNHSEIPLQEIPIKDTNDILKNISNTDIQKTQYEDIKDTKLSEEDYDTFVDELRNFQKMRANSETQKIQNGSRNKVEKLSEDDNTAYDEPKGQFLKNISNPTSQKNLNESTGKRRNLVKVYNDSLVNEKVDYLQENISLTTSRGTLNEGSGTDIKLNNDDDDESDNDKGNVQEIISNSTSQELLSKDSENYKEYVQKNLSDIVPPEAISISTEKDEDNLNRKIQINTSTGSIGSKVNKKIHSEIPLQEIPIKDTNDILKNISNTDIQKTQYEDIKDTKLSEEDYDTFVDELRNFQKMRANSETQKIQNGSRNKVEKLSEDDNTAYDEPKGQFLKNISNPTSQKNLNESTGKRRKLGKGYNDSLVNEKVDYLQENISLTTSRGTLNEGSGTDIKLNNDESDDDKGIVQEIISNSTSQKTIKNGTVNDSDTDKFFYKPEDFRTNVSNTTLQKTEENDYETFEDTEELSSTMSKVNKIVETYNDTCKDEQGNEQKIISTGTSNENINNENNKVKENFKNKDSNAISQEKKPVGTNTNRNTEESNNDTCKDEQGNEQNIISTGTSKENLSNENEKVKENFKNNDSNAKSQEERTVGINTNKNTEESNNFTCVYDHSEHNKKNDTNSKSNSGIQGRSKFNPITLDMKARTLYDTTIKQENDSSNKNLSEGDYSTFVDEQGNFPKNGSNSVTQKIQNDSRNKVEKLREDDDEAKVDGQEYLQTNILNTTSQESLINGIRKDIKLGEDDYNAYNKYDYDAYDEDDYNAYDEDKGNFHKNISNPPSQKNLNESIEKGTKIGEDANDPLVDEKVDYLQENISLTSSRDTLNESSGIDIKLNNDGYDEYDDDDEGDVSNSTSQKTINNGDTNIDYQNNLRTNILETILQERADYSNKKDIKFENHTHDKFFYKPEDFRKNISNTTLQKTVNGGIEKPKTLEEYDYDTFMDIEDYAKTMSKVNKLVVGKYNDTCKDEEGNEQNIISTGTSKENLSNENEKVKENFKNNDSNTKSQEERTVGINTNKNTEESNNFTCVYDYSEHNKKNDTNSKSNAGIQERSKFNPITLDMKARTLYDTTIKQENDSSNKNLSEGDYSTFVDEQGNFPKNGSNSVTQKIQNDSRNKVEKLREDDYEAIIDEQEYLQTNNLNTTSQESLIINGVRKEIELRKHDNDAFDDEKGNLHKNISNLTSQKTLNEATEKGRKIEEYTIDALADEKDILKKKNLITALTSISNDTMNTSSEAATNNEKSKNITEDYYYTYDDE